MNESINTHHHHSAAMNSSASTAIPKQQITVIIIRNAIIIGPVFMVSANAYDFSVGHLFRWTNFVFGGQTNQRHKRTRRIGCVDVLLVKYSNSVLMRLIQMYLLS